MLLQMMSQLLAYHTLVHLLDDLNGRDRTAVGWICAIFLLVCGYDMYLFPQGRPGASLEALLKDMYEGACSLLSTVFQ